MGSCCNVQGNESDRLGLHVVSTGVALAATLAGWLLPLAGLPSLALPALLLAYAAAGWDASIRAAGALRSRELDVDVLMLLAAAGAATVGHWPEGAVLLFLFSLGNTLEAFAFRRTRRSIEALVELSPDEAVLVEGGEKRAVAVETLRTGDIVRVRPGDQTALARIIAMVEEARESRAPTQNWIEEVEGRYAAGVILASGAAILIPWTLMGWISLTAGVIGHEGSTIVAVFNGLRLLADGNSS